MAWIRIADELHREIPGFPDPLLHAIFCCSGTYQAEAAQALETKRLQALCVTWNVNERFPEAGCPLFAWLRNTSATCNLAIIGLQEVEMGGGSVAMGTVKDNLFRGMQVCNRWVYLF